MIEQFFNEVLNNFPNVQTWQEHEEAIASLLRKYGIEHVQSPNGTQRFPDFRITVGGKEYDLEAKSGRGGVPMYNDSIPKQEAIYIFTHMRTLETVIYQGKDVISQEKNDDIIKLKELLLATCAEFEEVVPVLDGKGNIRARFRLFIEHRSFNLFTNEYRYDIIDRILQELTELENGN